MDINAGGRVTRSAVPRYYPARHTAVELRFQEHQYSHLTAQLHKLHPPATLPMTTRVLKLPCTAYGIPELHDRWCLPPWILHGGVFRQLDALNMNIELGVVRRVRGEYDSYF